MEDKIRLTGFSFSPDQVEQAIALLKEAKSKVAEEQ
jgi:hypothetical protein